MSEGSTDSYRTEITAILATVVVEFTQKLLPGPMNFSVEIPLLIGQAVTSFFTFAHHLGKFGTEWMEEILRFVTGLIALTQLGLISYYFFMELNCQEEKHLNVCKAGFYAFCIKAGLTALTGVGSNVFKRSPQTEMHVSNVRHQRSTLFSPRGNFAGQNPLNSRYPWNPNQENPFWAIP